MSDLGESSRSPAARFPEPWYSPGRAAFDGGTATYGLNLPGMQGWSNALARAREATAVARLAVYGTSRIHGALEAGVRNPKWRNSVAGQLRRAFDTALGGSSGTGWAMPWDEVFHYPDGDPRFTMGSAVTSGPVYALGPGIAYGPNGQSGAVIPPGPEGWLQFTPAQEAGTITSYWIVLVIAEGGGGLATVTVGGKEAGTISLAEDGAGGASLAREVSATAGMAVYRITGLPGGHHALRIHGVTAGACVVAMLKADTGQGVEVSSFARSGSTYAHWLRDDPAGRYGMRYSIDLPAPHLAIIGDFTNDRHDDVADVRMRAAALIERLLGAGSDILLLGLVGPDFAALGETTTSAKRWPQHIRTLYELRDEYGLAGVLDLNHAWVDHARAGGFADSMHEGQWLTRRMADALFALINR